MPFSLLLYALMLHFPFDVPRPRASESSVLCMTLGASCEFLV